MELRPSFNAAFILLLCSCIFHRPDVSRPLYLRNVPSRSSYRWDSRASKLPLPAGFGGNQSGAPGTLARRDGASPCSGLKRHANYERECEYVKAHRQCTSGGFIEYIEFFYCTCGKRPALGYAALGIWLAALFYMLGNTAGYYFCGCLEKLSDVLNLPPTVAGVTLLPLGNGAPDVFANVAAFVGAEAVEVGLNSVLGGAVFVTCVVAGTVSLLAANSGVAVDRKCFVRDLCFFLLALASLCAILIAGRVSLWGALGFVSIYFAHAFSVVASEFRARRLNLRSVAESQGSLYGSPLLDPGLYSDGAIPKTGDAADSGGRSCTGKILFALELPLALPRRVTIPIIEGDRWSRGFAVASAALAPLLLALLWDSRDSEPSGRDAYLAGGVLGSVLGTLAFCTTESKKPPQRLVFPWVAGGFLMCIVWFYIIANELLALLVSLGAILDIDASILGLTVLAWGNSMGDLMSNGALAMNGGSGVQIAVSGCYAGPMFNTVVGLGISLVVGSWGTQPAAFVIPEDPSLFYTLGFLAAALLWALVVLPSNGMRPNKLFGVGLLALYFAFLGVRLCKFLGFVAFDGWE